MCSNSFRAYQPTQAEIQDVQQRVANRHAHTSQNAAAVQAESSANAIQLQVRFLPSL